MQVLALISFLVLAQPAQQTAVPSPAWRAVATPVGPSLTVPVDLGAPKLAVQKDPAGKTATYTPKDWQGCELEVTRQAFDKDEDPSDPLAERLADVVLGEVDLDADRISRVSYGTLEGWPTVEIEAKLKDGSLAWYRVSRTKAQSILVCLSGSTLPDRATVKKVFDSLKMPQEIGPGKIAKWWPEGKAVTFADTHLQIWTPLDLKPSPDVPDFSEEKAKASVFQGEFGYNAYSLLCVEYPDEVGAERLEEDTLDSIMKSSVQGEDNSDTLKFGEFKTVKLGDISVRTVTYVDGTVEGRMDVVTKESRLYMLSAAGPRGMLDSDEFKKFFTSIVVK